MTSRSRIGVVGMTLSLLSLGAVAVAQTHERTVASTQSAARQEQEVRPGASSREHDGDIYGYQLMTERERGEYRERLRAATSDRELSRVRSEHRARMQARARERGVTLSGPKSGGGSVQWAVPAVDVRGGK
jgi:hypothetical protein